MSKFLNLLNGVEQPRRTITIPACEVRLGDYLDGERVTLAHRGETFMYLRTNAAECGWSLDYMLTVERPAE